MNFLNLNISKNKIDSYLSNVVNDSDYTIKKDEHYQINIDNGILNIYFKNNGKTSFMCQGKEKFTAEAFAINLISSM